MNTLLKCIGALGLAMAVLVLNSRADGTNIGVSADTFIVSSLPDNNAGANGHVAAGRNNQGSVRRGLFRFDLLSVPPGSLITSAEFRVSVIGTPPIPADSTFDLLPVIAGWSEGVQVGNSGAAAAAGEATWNSRFHGAALWSSAGGDFGAVIASSPVSGVGSYVWSGAALTATVQDWLDNPGGNNGLMLMSQLEGTAQTARQFGSRDGSSPAVLAIGFVAPVPPAEPPLIRDLRVTANVNVELSWGSTNSLRYDVQYARALSPTQDWRLAEANITAETNGLNVWMDPPYLASPLFSGNRTLYYRLDALPASPTGMPVHLQVVSSNLVSPTVVTHADDGSGRLFIAEQRGQIRVVNGSGVLLASPFLDLSARMTNLTPRAGTPGVDPIYDERGLLGLAFHPGYGTNGLFYVYYSSPKTGAGVNHESVVSEFHVSAGDPDSASTNERVVLRLDEPEFNHNGGSLAFGPEGYLYISTGDGGGAGDSHAPFGNGQNVSNLLGKILRIDVNGVPPYGIPPDNPFVSTPGADEIFAYGLRNPWKISFDGTNLWVADVGQNVWEEIDQVRRGGNYGWRIMEGFHAYDPSLAATVGVDVATLDVPVHDYKHGPLGISIIGGSVYRGAAYPALQGKYVFGDFSTSFGVADGALYYLAESRPGIWERFAFSLSPSGGRLHRYVKAFGADEAGEIYVVTTANLGPSGTTADVRKFIP